MFAGASLDENSGAFCELKANFFRLILTKAELQALTFTDLDLKSGIIHITKTYSVIDGKTVITPPKTPKSVRDILIPAFLCEILEDYKKRYYKPLPETRVFQMSRQPYREQMKQHCALAGVKRIRLHDLRHPYVKSTTKKYEDFFQLLKAS